MSEYTMEMKKAGKTKVKSGTLAEDQFAALYDAAAPEHARVSMGVSQSTDYGQLKVTATVSLLCNQNAVCIDKAGELAFYKARELMVDGWNVLCSEEG
jgi:hypothetical protein